MPSRYHQQIVMPLLKDFRMMRQLGVFDLFVEKLVSQHVPSSSGKQLTNGVPLEQVRTLLKRERIVQRLSLRDLAEQTGLDSANLGKLERGTDPNPTISTLNRIAAALGKKLVVAFVDAEGQNDASQKSDTLKTPPGNPLDELMHLPLLDELLHQPSIDELLQQPSIEEFWKEFSR